LHECDAMAVVHAASCDVDKVRLEVGEAWYHKKGYVDLSKKQWLALPEAEQINFFNVDDATKLGEEMQAYVEVNTTSEGGSEKKRKSIEALDASGFRNGKQMIDCAEQDCTTRKSQLETLAKLKENNIVSDRTVADYLNGAGMRNPEAVDQLGISVLCAFRRKIFALLSLQCLSVLVIAYLVANLGPVKDLQILYDSENLMRDCIICGVLWVLAMVSLGGVAAVRYDFPKNFIALSIFTVMVSIAVAAFAGPNVHLGLGLVLVGLVLTGIVVTIPCGGKVLQVFPVTFAIMLVCNAMGIFFMAFWQTWGGTFIHPMYVVLLMFLNSVGLCWAGHEIDRLCSRLKVDEYLLPIVLLWAEMLVALLLVFAIESMADAGGDCCDGCHMWAYTTWHCDCCIYNDGSHGNDKYRRQSPNQTESLAAPVPQQMTDGPQDATATTATDPVQQV